LTSNYSDIAERIADIIIDPDSLYGFADGVISVPTGLMYLGYGYLDIETRYSRSIDKERMVRAVADGLASVESLTEAFETIFDLFNTYVDEANQNAFYRKKAFSFIGKKVTISVITTTLISSLILKSGLLRNIAVKLLGGSFFISYCWWHG